MGKDKNMDMRLIYYYGDRDISKETRYKIAELIESDLENKSDSTSSAETYEDSSLVPVYKKIIFDRLDMYEFPQDKKIVFLNSLEDGDVIKKVIETSHEHISAIIDHELYKSRVSLYHWLYFCSSNLLSFPMNNSFTWGIFL